MDTQKINESRGFEVIGTHPTENSLEDQLNNKEYIGYFLSSDPDERDYFMKCPFCRGLIPDTGLCETVECDTCKKIIRIPENNFQEVKQASLYDEPLRHKKKHCKNILDCDEITLSKVFSAVQKISNHYVNNCGFDGINIFCIFAVRNMLTEWRQNLINQFLLQRALSSVI